MPVMGHVHPHKMSSSEKLRHFGGLPRRSCARIGVALMLAVGWSVLMTPRRVNTGARLLHLDFACEV